ncbi:MAG: CRISPR-associated endonuclease Cas2 [Defluviicoccus sp.]
MTQRLYLVAYDVSEPKRWRRVFRLMKGYGEWLQLSVFRCRLTEERRQRLAAALAKLIDPSADRVLIADLGLLPRALGSLEAIGEPLPHANEGPWIG